MGDNMAKSNKSKKHIDSQKSTKELKKQVPKIKTIPDPPKKSKK